MSANKFDSLVKQLREIMKKGTEQEVRDFLVDHIDEFPEDVKQKITFIFFQEGLAKTVHGKDKKVFDIQKDGLEIVRKLKKETEELENKSKIKKIEKSLDKDEK